MKKAVTMTIDKNVLEEAKKKAKQNRRSLSEFVSMELEKILKLKITKKNPDEARLKRRK